MSPVRNPEGARIACKVPFDRRINHICRALVFCCVLRKLIDFYRRIINGQVFRMGVFQLHHLAIAQCGVFRIHINCKMIQAFIFAVKCTVLRKVWNLIIYIHFFCEIKIVRSVADGISSPVLCRQFFEVYTIFYFQEISELIEIVICPVLLFRHGGSQ